MLERQGHVGHPQVSVRHGDGVPPGTVGGQGGLGFDRVEGDLDTVLGVAFLGDGSDEAVLLGDPEIGQRAAEVPGSCGVLGQVRRRHTDPELELPGETDPLEGAYVRSGATLAIVQPRAWLI